MRHPWFGHYPAGVPEEIDPRLFHSLPDMVADCVARYRARPALGCLGGFLSYGELDALSRAFAVFLQRQGLRQGDRVALMLPNLLQYPVALFGALRIGAVAVNVNPLYTSAELQHQLADAGIRAVVVLENFAGKLGTLNLPSLEQVVITGVADLHRRPRAWLLNLVNRYLRGGRRGRRGAPAYRWFRDALHEGLGGDLALPVLERDDLALLQYTGGTTGVAKGVMLTHGNLIANVLQTESWFAPRVTGEREIMITALPLYHIYALTANLLTFMRLGGMNYLIPDPRNLKGMIGELRRLPFTAMTGVNTLYKHLLSAADFATLDFSRLTLVSAGGMAVERDVAARWQALTGQLVLEGYGLTEASPIVSVNPVTTTAFNGSIGLPLPSTLCSIRDDDNQPLPHDTPGELCVRGPQVMRGYWQRPAETAQAIDAQGWLHTGDIATMDEQGYLRIVDRKKDTIIVSGFNVYPAEVERVIAALPGVAEVGVIGVPDPDTGEAVKALVVKSDPALTEQAVREAAHAQLTGYKRPHQVQFVDSIPKSQIGKILRRRLRETYL